MAGACKGLPIHTLVRGRFVMKDRTLVPGTRGWGRSVHAIQNMPPPRVAERRPDHVGDSSGRPEPPDEGSAPHDPARRS